MGMGVVRRRLEIFLTYLPPDCLSLDRYIVPRNYTIAYTRDTIEPIVYSWANQMTLQPRPWAGKVEKWSADLDARLKVAVSRYVAAIQESLRPDGLATGSGVAKYIGGGVVQSAVSQWLSAKSFPDIKYLFAMARRSQVTPGELLDHLCSEAGFFPSEALEEDDDYLSMAERYEQMCEAASPDQMLEFQQIWLNECLSRRSQEN